MVKWLKRKPHAVRLVEAMEGVDVNVYPPNPGWGQDPRESLEELAREIAVQIEHRQAAKKSSQPRTTRRAGESSESPEGDRETR